MYNNTYGTGSWVIEDSFKSWNTEWVKYKWEWMTSDDFNKVFWWAKWTAKPYDVVDEKVFNNTPQSFNYGTLGSFLWQNKYQDKKYIWECGKFVNDYLVHIWVTDAKNRYYDNDISTKLNSVNSYTPKEWTIAVFDYWFKSSDWINHWHVGIVTKVYSDWSFDVKDSNYNSDGIIQTRHINPWSTSLKWFFDPSQSAMSTTAQSSWVEWSIPWVPLTFERSVKNLVPAALQNSDAEREALNKVITNAYNWWANEMDVALQYMWFNITNPDNKDFAVSLVNTIRTLPEIPEWTIKNVSDLINLWQKSKAIQLTENLISKQAQSADNYIPESTVKNALYKSNELTNFMNSLGKSPTWVVKWTMQEWLGKLSSKDSKELANYIAQLQNSLNIKDKDLANRLIPQLSDQPSVFATKLANLNSNLMQELNWWREIYWLPALDETSVGNYANRISLYENNTNWWVQIVNNVNNWSIESSISNLQSKYWIK